MDKYKLWSEQCVCVCMCAHALSLSLPICTRWDEAACRLLLGFHGAVVNGGRTWNQAGWWCNMELCLCSNFGGWFNGFLCCSLWLCTQPPMQLLNCRMCWHTYNICYTYRNGTVCSTYGNGTACCTYGNSTVLCTYGMVWCTYGNGTICTYGNGMVCCR
jgi:hypothetical protein